MCCQIDTAHSKSIPMVVIRYCCCCCCFIVDWNRFDWMNEWNVPKWEGDGGGESSSGGPQLNVERNMRTLVALAQVKKNLLVCCVLVVESSSSLLFFSRFWIRSSMRSTSCPCRFNISALISAVAYRYLTNNDDIWFWFSKSEIWIGSIPIATIGTTDRSCRLSFPKYRIRIFL